VRDYRQDVDELAALMDAFKLSDASLTLNGFRVSFRRHSEKSAPTATDSIEFVEAIEIEELAESPAAEVVSRFSVSSPMAGIFYDTSSPNNPPFVKVGESISAGQTVCLIEAMKVFNEIPSPVSGTVLEIMVESGEVVQPGQPLVRIG
jgi:acetyl-CoA carboxylase biotin carboxyl carrier protein